MMRRSNEGQQDATRCRQARPLQRNPPEPRVKFLVIWQIEISLLSREILKSVARMPDYARPLEKQGKILARYHIPGSHGGRVDLRRRLQRGTRYAARALAGVQLLPLPGVSAGRHDAAGVCSAAVATLTLTLSLVRERAEKDTITLFVILPTLFVILRAQTVTKFLINARRIEFPSPWIFWSPLSEIFFL